jgi:hypothetical protein
LADGLGVFHADSVPRTDLEIVVAGVLVETDAEFAADTGIEVNADELLRRDVRLDFVDAIDGADFDAGVAARASVLIDDGELLGKVLTDVGLLLGHVL